MLHVDGDEPALTVLEVGSAPVRVPVESVIAPAPIREVDVVLTSTSQSQTGVLGSGR